MLKSPRHFYGEPRIETERKPKSEVFFFLLAVLCPLTGLAAYTFW